MTTGRIHSCESFGTLDGPGIRYIVFLQGCPLRCKYCHNPDTWDFSGGKTVSVSDIMQQIESCRNYLSGGVTLSGGEPLGQPEFVLALLEECRKKGFHTALDTAGSYPLEYSAKILDAADLILLDIKALDDPLCRELTGAGCENTLRTLEYCERNKKDVWIRHVLVPGWTLKQDRLRTLSEFLAPFQCIQRVELLPFHKMAEFKWEKMGIPFPFSGIPEPEKKDVSEAQKLFGNIGNISH